MTWKTCPTELHVDIVLQSVCPELFCGYHTQAVQSERVSRRNIACSNLNCFYGSRKHLELFLKINGVNFSQLKEELNTIGDSWIVSMARNKMPRTHTSLYYKNKQPHHGHHLRVRRHTTFTNNFVDMSGDDDSNHTKPVRELRSSNRVSLVQNKTYEQDMDMWNSGRPKRACIKNKVDDQHNSENKNFLKIDVGKHKLRSSEIYQELGAGKNMKPLIRASEEQEHKNILKLPFKKLRNAELTRLNNEAENFLFPHKEESNSEDEAVIGSSISTKKKKACDSSNNNDKMIKTKHEQEEESSMDSVLSETSSVIRKRRRLTQAEAFILDNQQYYKFETPGSRLRYQGSYLAPITSKNNGEYGTHKQKISESSNAKVKFNLEEITFSFEKIPCMESWYKTFQRQDNGEEYYLSNIYNNSGFYKPFILPYEMGFLPPLDPRICFHYYFESKKGIVGDCSFTSTACSTPNSEIPKLDEFTTGEDTKSSEDSTTASEPTDNCFLKSKALTRSNNRYICNSSKNPRKSPRQHASTLAILSSLIHQRKRNFKPRGSDQNNSKCNLSIISEESRDEEQNIQPDIEELAKNITDMLNTSSVEIDNVVPEDGVDMHSKPDAIYVLDDFICFGKEYNAPTATAPKLNSETRKPYRKKKKNRTGWPNKSRKSAFRKEGSNSRDGLANSETDSITASPEISLKYNNEENLEDNNWNRTKPQTLETRDRYHLKKINGDIQVQSNKLNGVSDSYEFNFRNLTTPRRKEHREPSSDNCAEVVIASVGDKIDCVNVRLDEWENAERVLSAKLRSEVTDIQFQPIVRVQKLDNEIMKQTERHILENVSSRRTRSRRMPASPKSPRMLRKPRGKWYREKCSN